MQKLKSLNLIFLTVLFALFVSLVLVKPKASAQVKDINYYKAEISKKSYLEKLDILKERNLVFKAKESTDMYSQHTKLTAEQKSKALEIEKKMLKTLQTDGLSDKGVLELDLDGMEILDLDANFTKIIYSFLTKPEYFWLNGSINKTIVTATKKVKTVTLQTYFENQNDFRQALDEFLAYSEYYIWQVGYKDTNLDGIITRAEIALNLHDSILNHKPYNKLAAENLNSDDFSLKIAHSAYSVYSKNNLPVCDGYAKAYAYALNKLGIPTLTTGGHANGPHAWNYVYLNESWYFVDLTWDQNLNGGPISHNHFLKTQPNSHQNQADSFNAYEITFDPIKPKLANFSFGGLKQEDESALSNEKILEFQTGEFDLGANLEQANQLIEQILKHLEIMSKRPVYLAWTLKKAGITKRLVDEHGDYILEITAALETNIATKRILIKTNAKGTTKVKVNSPFGQTELVADLGARLNYFPKLTYLDKTFVGFDKDITIVKDSLKEVTALYESGRKLIDFLIKDEKGTPLYHGKMLKGTSLENALKNNFLKAFFPHLTLGSKFSHLEHKGKEFNPRTVLNENTEVKAIARFSEPNERSKKTEVKHILKYGDFEKEIDKTNLLNSSGLFDIPDLSKFGWELDLVNSDVTPLAGQFKLKDPLNTSPKIYYKPIYDRLKEITLNTTLNKDAFKNPGKHKFKYISGITFNSKYQLFDVNHLNQECRPGYSLVLWQVKGLGETFDVNQNKYTSDLELIPKVVKAKVELLYKEEGKTLDFNKEGIANAAQIAKLTPPAGENSLFLGWLTENNNYIYSGYSIEKDTQAWAQYVSKKELISKLNWEVFKNGKFILTTKELNSQDFSRTKALIQKRFPGIDIKKIEVSQQKVKLTLGSLYSSHLVEWEFEFVKDPIIYWDFFKDPLMFFKKFPKQAAIIGGLTLTLSALSLIMLISVIKVFKRSVKNKD